MSNRLLSAAVGLTAVLLSSSTQAQAIDVVMAIPSPSLSFAATFVAEDMGLYKNEGLNVSTRNLVGVAAPNAVLAGSAHFTIGQGPTFVRAASQGQRFYALANLIDKPLVEFVLRKDVAERVGITEGMPIAEKAKRLKGLTIGIQGVGSIIHAWARYVIAKGGLDVEKDVRIAPMDPAAMLPALENKAIDGFAVVIPFTTQAILKGNAIMLASAITDAPELVPFGGAVLYALPTTCQKNREMCVRMGKTYSSATKLIQEQSDKVFEEVLTKRFPKMEPDLLKAAWKQALMAHAKDIRVTDKQLENSQTVSIEAKLLDPKEVLKSFEGLYTDEFVK
jgi:ABC-type nitrate/sulfonate/bicarbonate transport system substrate-binding protein